MSELDTYRKTTLFCVDDEEKLFISPAIRGWEPIHSRGIDVVFDLEGEIDHGIPTVPDTILYVYFPIKDEELPNLSKLQRLADLGASLIRDGHCVLSHCGMGFNRSALLAGLILHRLDFGTGDEVVSRLRQRRPGALFNETFARFLDDLTV